jgi:hypothetical protein
MKSNTSIKEALSFPKITFKDIKSFFSWVLLFAMIVYGYSLYQRYEIATEKHDMIKSEIGVLYKTWASRKTRDTTINWILQRF